MAMNNVQTNLKFSIQ